MSLALYIHVPYCLTKCPYCDFHSIEIQKDQMEQERYAQILIHQWELEVARLKLEGKKLTSIFFGGGTPSLMSPAFFETVLAAISKKVVVDEETEITVETNPRTASQAQFKRWLKLGINRISFGIQSFQEKYLKQLGRNHSSNEALQAVSQAKAAGFKNINADFIFGLQGQTLKDLKSDLEKAASLEIPHLSFYQLTIEPQTPLASWVKNGHYRLPEEPILEKMHRLIPKFLATKNLHRYEISNYAQKGFECRHNLAYWRYQDYLGLGSGAVSFVNQERWRTTKNLKKYFQENFEKEDAETIDQITGTKERWMMGLRLEEGIADGGIVDALHPWIQKGAIHRNGDKIRLTPYGFLWYNQIVSDIFSMIEKQNQIV